MDPPILEDAPARSWLRRSWATLGLLLVSVVWGTTFVTVKTALAYASPLVFVGMRFALAALAAIPFVSSRAEDRRIAFSLGTPLGLVLAGAYASQTLGLTVTTPTRSAFVTGLNVTLVPLWAFVLFRHHPGRWTAIAFLFTLPGLWLLTSPGRGAWNRGDSWTIACAILYALYLVLVERGARRAHLGTFLFAQLAATSAVCLAAAPILERPRFSLHPLLLAALGVTAVLATTGTTWLQLRCQPRVGFTRTAFIFATEPVFAAFFSWLLIGETLTVTAWLGGCLILAGMLVSELGAAPRGS